MPMRFQYVQSVKDTLRETKSNIFSKRFVLPHKKKREKRVGVDRMKNTLPPKHKRNKGLHCGLRGSGVGGGFI